MSARPDYQHPPEIQPQQMGKRLELISPHPGASGCPPRCSRSIRWCWRPCQCRRHLSRTATDTKMTTEVAKKAKMAPEPCCNCGHLPNGQDTIPTRRDAFRPEVSSGHATIFHFADRLSAYRAGFQSLSLSVFADNRSARPSRPRSTSSNPSSPTSRCTSTPTPSSRTRR